MTISDERLKDLVKSQVQKLIDHDGVDLTALRLEVIQLARVRRCEAAECDAMRAFYCRDNTGISQEEWCNLGDRASAARTATDAARREMEGT